MLERAGIDEGGISALVALIALLRDGAPRLHLHDVHSPFVSTGEIILLGELGRRQRLNPQPFRKGVSWPLSAEPPLDMLLRAAATALGDAGLFIFHRTISRAGDLACEVAPRQEAIR